MNTEYRIRPKKCRHVFHIECMLQWWTEGTCPVCGVSFAPDGPRLQAASVSGGKARSSAGASLAGVNHALRAASPVGDRASSLGGRSRSGSRSPTSGGRRTPVAAGAVQPLQSRPAGLPGPGTFGGGDIAAAGLRVVAEDNDNAMIVSESFC
jgi:hypothetical protein